MWLGKWLFQQRRKKTEMISYYKEVFQKSYAGKYVLADLCRHGHVDQNTFNPTSTEVTAFNEGKRAMALHILNTLGLNPNQFVSQFHLEVNSPEEESL